MAMRFNSMHLYLTMRSYWRGVAPMCSSQSKARFNDMVVKAVATDWSRLSLGQCRSFLMCCSAPVAALLTSPLFAQPPTDLRLGLQSVGSELAVVKHLADGEEF